eukprot:CAMPEP_0184703270 /NCGR_PEP_ID=MMETSP0313-20130426/27175_1 /TAXON_ID=2792 /ORGANISM="Porphyridium aerugineum, Strain SAG 1380-2" /LENGTH=405 /DNA_ID=CAMNT_0027163991 /DNA_START=215 /DNA_END=1432 /DNA_ORIENTATION=-
MTAILGTEAEASSSVSTKLEPSKFVAPKKLEERFSIAPMLDVTHDHFRTLCRMMSKRAVLYTEMVVDNTLIYNSDNPDFIDRSLAYGANQHPIVLQLGGSSPDKLALAAQIAAKYRYDAINLNCGCPSPKVAGKGCFGAALMLEPHNVAQACRKMAEAMDYSVPITVKCRIGVDKTEDSYDFVSNFVKIVREEGQVFHFAIHARAAWLNGLSPAQNRNIPPLRHEYIPRLAHDFPDCTFVSNGGITDLERCKEMLSTPGVSGVMLGRAIRDNPWTLLSGVDSEIYHDSSTNTHLLSRDAIVREYAEYTATCYGQKHMNSAWMLVMPVLDIFHGAPKGKVFRKRIDDALKAGQAPREAILHGLEGVDESVRMMNRVEWLGWMEEMKAAAELRAAARASTNESELVC